MFVIYNCTAKEFKAVNNYISFDDTGNGRKAVDFV